jgi:hypothetical protein
MKTVLAALFVLLPLTVASLARADVPSPSPSPAPDASEAPSAQTFYVAALKAMRELPQPSFVTYRLESRSEGLQVGLTVTNGLLWLLIGQGSIPSQWAMRHRTNDYETEVYDEFSERRYVTQRSFFDPTWYGSYRALRDGMLGYQDIEAPVSARATPQPMPSSNLKTIEVETVMGPGIYTVQDSGSATCSNGDPGHALHLVPRSKDPRRQLTDVIVDLRSMRFCMIRYSWPNSFGFHGVVEQHYADVAGYWMQTDGILDGTLRAFGISTHHGVWLYRLTDMQFPRSIPPMAFVPGPEQQSY